MLSFHALLGLLFATAILYLTMCFSQFERHAEKIVAAMRDQNIDLARQQFERWEDVNTNRYSYTQLAGVSIETTLSRAHYGLFGPLLWFIALGPGGVILYRLAYLLKIEWQAPLGSAFSQLSQYIFELVDWLPARITATCFAIVGDFEDAIYCWRTQAASWPDKALGVILASGGGALGVKLGDPMPYQGVVVFRPELGLGDEADADYLQSAIGMVWRVLLLLLSLLLLLTLLTGWATSPQKIMDILLANPRGFCAGVDRAIIIVEEALEKFGAPIYVRHEVVHNKFVVDELKGKGAIFVEELDEVPTGSTVIFSAHGVSIEVRSEAEKRGLRVFDATCPLVTKVHSEVARMHKENLEIIMIGHKGHPEVEGTMGNPTAACIWWKHQRTCWHLKSKTLPGWPT